MIQLVCVSVLRGELGRLAQGKNRACTLDFFIHTFTILYNQVAFANLTLCEPHPCIVSCAPRHHNSYCRCGRHFTRKVCACGGMLLSPVLSLLMSAAFSTEKGIWACRSGNEISPYPLLNSLSYFRERKSYCMTSVSRDLPSFR